MSLINGVIPQQAEGEVAKVYGEIEQALGRVPGGMQLFSISPAMLEQHWQQILYYVGHPRLSMPLLAMIRMLVSEKNECKYCVDFNGAMLMHRAGLSADQLAQIKMDPSTAPLPEKEKAMLLFVLKAVEAPRSIEPEDLERLRSMGWSDGDIFDGVHHGARNLAVDVILNTFQVENDA